MKKIAPSTKNIDRNYDGKTSPFEGGKIKGYIYRRAKSNAGQGIGYNR